jgi:magnesium transporter
MINKDYIITISFRENENVDILKTKKFKHEKAMVLLNLLLVSSKTYIKYLKEIDTKIKAIEEKFESVQRNKEISDLLDLKKSLVYFNTSLQSDQILLEKIERNKDFVNSEDDKDVIDDVIDENKQAIVVTEIYNNIIEDATNRFNSVISNNLNKTLKLLTSITVVITIPTVISSIYGMNVSLPLEHHKYAFIIIMGLTVILSTLCVLILWKYDMF